jgi:hypothetical protein
MSEQTLSSRPINKYNSYRSAEPSLDPELARDNPPLPLAYGVRGRGLAGIIVQLHDTSHNTHNPHALPYKE